MFFCKLTFCLICDCEVIKEGVSAVLLGIQNGGRGESNKCQTSNIKNIVFPAISKPYKFFLFPLLLFPNSGCGSPNPLRHGSHWHGRTRTRPSCRQGDLDSGLLWTKSCSWGTASAVAGWNTGLNEGLEWARVSRWGGLEMESRPQKGAGRARTCAGCLH